MSYESEMEITKPIWTDNGQFEGVKKIGDYRDMPLSKLPIRKKLYRAIMEKLQFSNLESNVATAIRWVGDNYIVSFRSTWNSAKTQDIAVGTKGEYPFMFRSPFTGAPTSGLVPSYNGDTWAMREVTPDYCYYYYHNVPIATRLGTLGFDTFRKKVAVGRKMNEKTHKMNNVYASVPHLIVDRALITPPEIGQYKYEVVKKNGDDYRCTIVPLFKHAWYFRDGTIASESQAMTIDVNQI